MAEPQISTDSKAWTTASPAVIAASPPFAALDLGTNNCRLLIATPTRHGFRVIDSFSRIVRLGEGLQSSGRLSESAMERAIVALRHCAERIHRRELSDLRAVATEACRRAQNGRIFLDRVHRETGLAIDIISTREEAELAVESCAALLRADLPSRGPDATARPRGDLRPQAAAIGELPDPARGRALLFDIGGGSTEIAWIRMDDPRIDTGSGLVDGRSDRLCPTLVGYESLPVGILTLGEHFGGRARSSNDYEAMVDYVTAQLLHFEDVHRIRREVESGDVRLLGTSGTVTTVASVALNLRRYRRADVDGTILSQGQATAALSLLRRLGPEGLSRHGCIGADRVASVLPGCAIFDAIYRLWPADSVVVADRGLRDGMLLRMMQSVDRSAGLPRQRSPTRHAWVRNGGAVLST